jgi:hypothetical protein
MMKSQLWVLLFCANFMSTVLIRSPLLLRRTISDGINKEIPSYRTCALALAIRGNIKSCFRIGEFFERCSHNLRGGGLGLDEYNQVLLAQICI